MKIDEMVKLKRVSPGVVNHHILMVDDDPVARTIVSKLLSYYGFKVDMANNGLEALLALERNRYKLVLMDCTMNVMNGYEATARIRDLNSKVLQRDIPIIALTGKTMSHEVAECVSVGMNDHLNKPLILKDLLEKLEAWIPC